MDFEIDADIKPAMRKRLAAYAPPGYPIGARDTTSEVIDGLGRRLSSLASLMPSKGFDACPPHPDLVAYLDVIGQRINPKAEYGVAFFLGDRFCALAALTPSGFLSYYGRDRLMIEEVQHRYEAALLDASANLHTLNKLS